MSKKYKNQKENDQEKNDQDKPFFNLSSIYLYLTDYCNLNCSHCWITPNFVKDNKNKDNKEKKSKLAIEALKKTIIDAKELGLSSVKLTGGEPLLHENISELITFFAIENLDVSIETNGTILDDNIKAILFNKNISQISVSIDAANEKIHDKIRGVKKSFKKSAEFVKFLAEHNINSQIIMTLQKNNMDEIDSMVDLAKKIGANSLKINNLQPWGRGTKLFDDKKNINFDEILSIYKTIEKKYIQKKDFNICFDIPIAFKTLDEIKNDSTSQCNILNILGILADGSYSICGIGQTLKALRMGNIETDSIKDVWLNNEILCDLRTSLPKKLTGICKKCIFKFECLGGCRANAYGLTKDFYAPYFFCQNQYEEKKFPKSRYV